MSLQQVHNKFKIFTGTLAADKTLGPLADEIALFAFKERIAAKSIGVEYIESAKKLIISLGYSDDEPFYPIEVKSVPLGKVGDLGEADVARLEQAMSASATEDKIICHELYVTDEGDFVTIFMVSHAPPADAAPGS